MIAAIFIFIAQALTLVDPALLRIATASSVTTYLVSEDAETGSTPSDFTDTGGVIWGDTTSPAPLFGSGSIFLTNSSASTKVDLGSAYDDLWVFWVDNVSLTPADTSVSLYSLQVYEADGSTIVGNVRYRAAGYDISVATVGAGYEISAADTISHSTNNYFWLRWQLNNGSTLLQADLYISTNGPTRPASPTLTRAIGDSGSYSGVRYVEFLSPINNASIGSHKDYIRIDDVEIGSAP